MLYGKGNHIANCIVYCIVIAVLLRMLFLVSSFDIDLWRLIIIGLLLVILCAVGCIGELTLRKMKSQGKSIVETEKIRGIYVALIAIIGVISAAITLILVRV